MILSKICKPFDWVILGILYIPCVILFASSLACSLPGFIVSVVLFCLCIIPLIILLVISGVNSSSGKASLTLHISRIKLASIPFFLLNVASFFLCLVNNVLGLGIIVFGVVFIFFNYLVMFRTSLPLIISYTKAIGANRIKLNLFAVIFLITLFIFCLDVIGAIALKHNELSYGDGSQNEVAAEAMKKAEKWKKRKGPSSAIFKNINIICSIVQLICSVTIFGFIIYGFIDGEHDVIIEFGAFLAAIILTFVISLIRFIINFYFGKIIKKDPLNFAFIMKLIDIPTILFLHISVIICFIMSAFFGLLSYLLIPFIVVIIVLFMIVASMMAAVGYATFGTGIAFAQSLISFSGNVAVFNYYFNQRIILNRKFANYKVVLLMIMLWIPILDYVSMIVLKILKRDNKIFGDEELIKIKPSLETIDFTKPE